MQRAASETGKVNNRPRGGASADMLAYVDDCLSSHDCRALEARMVHEPEVRSQVDRWLAQNEAIRAAFAASPPRPFASEGVELRKVNFAADRKIQGLRAPREYKDSPPRPSPNGASASDLRRTVGVSAPIQGSAGGSGRRLARRTFAALLGAATILAASVLASSDEPAAAAAKAGIGAYRTFADNGTHPVEVATSDRGALNKWFAPQIGRPAPVPDLAASGLALIGGRIVPGASSPAAFLVYETPGRERIGLAMEAIDSPPASGVEMREVGGVACAVWTADGHSFALVGHGSQARLAELARLIRLGQLKI
jgi:anti-sigma factor RsiW